MGTDTAQTQGSTSDNQDGPTSETKSEMTPLSSPTPFGSDGDGGWQGDGRPG